MRAFYLRHFGLVTLARVLPKLILGYDARSRGGTEYSPGRAPRIGEESRRAHGHAERRQSSSLHQAAPLVR